MNYLVAAGGTGQEIVAACLRLAYLAGLEFPKIRVIDSDFGAYESGTSAETRTQVLRRLLGELEELGPAAGADIDFLSPAASSDSADDFRNVVDVFGTARDLSDRDRELLDLLLDDRQRSLTINDGFHGEPALGSLVFTRAMERGSFNGLFADIEADANSAAGARLVFAGSIAGGVGTAVVPVLMKRLARLRAGLGNAGNLRILSLLQVPWFRLVDHAGEDEVMRADVLQSMFDRNASCLVKGYLAADRDNVFEKMLLLGLPKPVNRLSQGGDTQMETHHFMSVLSGIYALNLQSEKAVERMCGHDDRTFAAPELDVEPPSGPLGSGGDPPTLYLPSGAGMTIRQLTIVARGLDAFTQAVLDDIGPENGSAHLSPSLTHTAIVANALSPLSNQEREAFRMALIRFAAVHREITFWLEQCLRSRVKEREVFVPGLFEPEGGRWEDYFSVAVADVLRELGVNVFLRRPPVARKLIQRLNPAKQIDRTFGGKKAAWALVEQVRTRLINEVR